MSSTFFRASCVVFWFTWLISLAYVIGISIFENRYIPPVHDYYDASDLVKVVCYINVWLAIFGCIFVKCDISHVICFLLYCIPSFLLVPILCIHTLLQFRNHVVKTLTVQNLTNLAQIQWNSQTQSWTQPYWLQRTELDQRCCGISSYKDYGGRNYENFTSNPYAHIPVTCCKKISPATYEETSKPIYCLKSSTDMDKIKDFINVKGCMKSIQTSFADVNLSHNAFLVIMIFSSLFMFLTYVKTWCGSRNFNGNRSDHSLDTESLCNIDLTSHQTMAPLLTSQKSETAQRTVKIGEVSSVPVVPGAAGPAASATVPVAPAAVPVVPAAVPVVPTALPVFKAVEPGQKPKKVRLPTETDWQ